MNSPSKIIFISTPHNRTFAKVLADVVQPYGKLEICSWQEKPDLADYALILLDAGVLTELDTPNSLTELLEQLFQVYPAANIVVTTTSATWKRTREALLAGAIDYFRQTLDPDSLRNYLNPTLDKYLRKNQEIGE